MVVKMKRTDWCIGWRRSVVVRQLVKSIITFVERKGDREG
jgi:hypothetical protein